MDVMEFLKENWLLVVVGIVVVIFLIRAMFKLALVALVIGAVVFFAFGYSPSDVINFGKNIVNTSIGAYDSTIKSVLEKELDQAEYSINPDGSFLMKTASVSLKGKEGAKTVTISYKDKEVVVEVDKLGGLIQQQIDSIQSEMNSLPAK